MAQKPMNGYLKYLPLFLFVATLIGTAYVIFIDVGRLNTITTAHELRLADCEKVDARVDERMKRIEDKLDDFIDEQRAANTEQRAVNTQVIEWLRTNNNR